jgi:hypothetical protein
MRDDGEVLTLTHENGESVWRLLHSGRRISSLTANRIICAADVQSAGDALFSGMPAQTYIARAR